jgi:RecJ-like exonuclease
LIFYKKKLIIKKNKKLFRSIFYLHKWCTSLINRARKIAEIIKKSKEIHIVTHIDADGITAGAIAVHTLKRLGKNYSIEFVKQLDKNKIEKLKNENHDLVWFTDLGSSISSNNTIKNKIITDHHSCNQDTNHTYHLNPHLFGLDGGFDLSGAGATYLVSKAINKKNIDLSSLAIVGACGDLQDKKNHKLIGLNQDILKDGVISKQIKSKMDISYFGRETRPIYKLLQFANDPIIPGLTGRESACISFLKNLNIKMKDGDKWRYWVHLSKNDRSKIISNIAKILLSKGFGYKITKRIISEIYILKKEKEGTELHDAKEYATLLNSTARYGKYLVGLNVCLGDRDKWLKDAQNLLRGHRNNLVEGLQFAKDEGIERREYLQFFHAKSGIRDTIIGIVTNMLLNSFDVSNDLPLIGFAYKDNFEVKASGRATQELVEKGLNLSIAMNLAAKQFDGIGGGHKIAAGATIPKGKEEEFLILLEKKIKTQLSS